MKNKYTKSLISNLQKIGLVAVRYRFLIGFLAVAGAIAYVLQVSNYYARVERDENAITEGLAAVKRVKFDQDAINKIRSLNDPNIKIDPNLPQNRTNPFQN